MSIKYMFLVVTGIILAGIVTTLLVFLFETYWWLGFLVFLPLYIVGGKEIMNKHKTFKEMGVKKYLKIDKPLNELIRGKNK